MANQSVALRWLQERPPLPGGVTWGVPWEEGALRRDEPLALVSSAGERLPVQSWATAYWPDGSVKWTAHAASVPAHAAPAYSLVKGEPAAGAAGLIVRETEAHIEVETGSMMYRINRQGPSIVASIACDGQEICAGARLVAVNERRSAASGMQVRTEEQYRGEVARATVEQRGPVRVVVKAEGRHRAASGARKWLPFTVRLYFYAGQRGFRIVHTFHYDGNPHEDFVQGLGMTFRVPLRGPLYNRHVRLAGDTGLFRESPKLLATLRTTGGYAALYERQTAGEPVALDPQEDAPFLALLDDSAVWDSFKLVQHSADHYRIAKRTKPACAWVKAGEGRRAGGLAYAGGEGGGLALGLRSFWQKHPSALEIAGMSGDEAELTAWFWSPDAQPMDLRHYDTETHVESSYEGFAELRSTPYGIANTSELAVWCADRTPATETLLAMARESQAPSLLVCEPAHYRRAGAFGVWSVADRSTPDKAHVEDQLDAVVQFYKDEIEQRRWYGFWDYGDIMHTYDPVRHIWCYDIGGRAWQNTELVPNMWLWYMFLRSGRADIFRLAEAMTRHTSETDVYHFGEYAGLGSRHNVVHWGCGCKEARISMAGLHRYYYYLTADERIGDLMDEVKDADYATVRLDPMRAYFPKDEFPTHTRVGPDWAAFSSNWMTRWERYEETAYRDKIRVGIESLKRMPHRLLTGPVHGYDPESGEMMYFGDDNYIRHLAVCMGAPQVWFELARLLGDPDWEDMMAEFGAFYLLPPEEKERLTGGVIGGANFGRPILTAAIIAYAAHRRNDAALARQVWSILLAHPIGGGGLQGAREQEEYIRTVRETPWITTNEAVQWSLGAIAALELIGDALADARKS